MSRITIKLKRHRLVFDTGWGWGEGQITNQLRFQDVIKTKLETETGNWKVEKRHLKQRLKIKNQSKINSIIDVRRLSAFEDKGKYLLSI